MKYKYQIVPIIIVLSLLPLSFFSCNNSKVEVLNIPVKVELVDTPLGTTECKVISVTKEKLIQPYNNPFPTSDQDKNILEVGEPCIIVTLEIQNNTDNNTFLLMSAKGYDNDRVQKSEILDPGPIVGLAMYDLPSRNSSTINITMNWADNLSNIEIQGTVHAGDSLISPTPFTPVTGEGN